MSTVTFATKESVAAAPSRQIRIGEPGDAYEREAERVADEILAGGTGTRHWSLPRANPETPALRRCSCGRSSSSEGECAACKQKREAHGPTLRRQPAAGFESAVAPPIVHQVLNSPGQPLDTATREYFEPRLGRDLTPVRVHSDSVAAESAGAVRAKAYTVGNHIAFAGGQFAPWTSAGRTLLGHELVHVAQQAGGAPTYLARAGEPYVSPYTETLAAELFERLRQLRIAEGGASAAQQAQRVGAVAALFDRQGNRLATIARMNVSGGAHAEELVVQEIQRQIAAGLKIEYTVLMIDQDPCLGTCTPLLKEWRGQPASGTLRVVTPVAVNKRDPSRMVSGKTAYKRALTQDNIPFEPNVPPPDYAASIKTRGEVSRVRPPLYKEPPPPPPGSVSPAPASGAGSDVAADVTARTEAAAAKAVGKAEEHTAVHALEDAAAARVSKQITNTAEKDLAEAGAEAFSKSATSAASRRLGQAVAPVVGAAFAAPDAWKGVQDIAHGNVVLGLGTIGVAIIDVAAQGLHLTDEITAGGGTILAITIQTWAATMQFAFESVRITGRAAELKAYMKAHANALPPRAELMSYYGLNDEDILLLENDIYKAQQRSVSTEDLATEVRSLLAQIDANASKPLPEGVTPEGIQRERASLSKLLVALDAENGRKRAQAVRDRAAADEKRRQANLDRAQQQQKQAAAAPATQQLLPVPGAAQQQPAAGNDPFGILSPAGAQPLNRISAENAELAGTWFGRSRTTLLSRYRQLESEHFPSDKVRAFQGDVNAYVSTLDRAITEYMKKGSAEWPGVKEMRRLRDAADNDDRSRLMR